MENESLTYRVVVSERSTRMLVAHAAFLARVSPEAAEALTVAFEQAANSLESMPKRCPWYKDPSIPANVYRYLLFAKRYELIFQIREDAVYVDYVLDARQDDALPS